MSGDAIKCPRCWSTTWRNIGGHGDGACNECVGIPLYRIDDPAAFWSALTPAQALALLRSTPFVASEWTDVSNAGVVAFKRLDMMCNEVAGAFEQGHAWWRTPGRISGIRVPSLDAAKQDADAALRAAGWLLVDDDRT